MSADLASRLTQVPAELRGSAQWVAWWLVKGEGKPVRLPGGKTKVLEPRPKPHKLPINPHSGNLAATDNPSTWATHDAAVAAAERFRVTGVGFVFTANDSYLGVDLDHCRDPETGTINNAAAAIISELNSYTEVSPSGTGVKIFLRAAVPGPRHRTKYEGGEIEMYGAGRYFTVTGERLPEASCAVQSRESELAAVYQRLFGAAAPNKNVKPAEAERHQPAAPEPMPASDTLLQNLSDNDIIDLARLARNGTKFTALFAHGDTSEYGGNRSSADIALCNMLAFWCRKNPARMDSLFRQSGLMRPKWDEKHSADGATYGQMTIRRALDLTHAVYEPNREYPGSAGESGAIGGNESEPAEQEPTAEGAERSAPDTAPGSTSVPATQVRKSQSLILIKLAESFEYFHSADETAYVTFWVKGHFETHPVRARGFRLHLQHLFYRERNNAISSKALADGIGVLEAKALFDGLQRNVYTRVGQHDGRTFLDEGGDDWAAIEVDREGWRRAANPPVRFIRPRGMRPLPTPVRADGALDAFGRALNFFDANDFKLLLGWLLGAFRASGPYPLLSFRSAHGTGKTTASRLARALIDPNEVPMRTAPRDEQDVFLAASHSWVLAFDNVSKISESFSDAMCRLSTGGGYGKRELYTNDEEYIFSAQRPVIINSIDDSIRRTDLLDRTIQIELAEISKENRLPEADFWNKAGEFAPGVVACLLDGVAEAIRNLPTIDLPSLPRMADFAAWVEAGAPAFGWRPEEFLRVYRANRTQLTAATLESSPVGRQLLGLKDWSQEVWEGTATELLRALEEAADERAKRHPEWPRSPRGMSNVLRELMPSLREAGVAVVFDRGNTANRDRIIRLKAATPIQVRLFKKPEPEYPD